MILDISISIIAIAVVVLVVFAVITLIRVKKVATEIVPLVKEVTTLAKTVNGVVCPCKKENDLGCNIGEWIAVTLAIINKLRRHQ